MTMEYVADGAGPRIGFLSIVLRRLLRGQNVQLRGVSICLNTFRLLSDTNVEVAYHAAVRICFMLCSVHDAGFCSAVASFMRLS